MTQSHQLFQAGLLLQSMARDGLHNYIAPGVSSYLIGGPNHGAIRMFSVERDTREHIIPHNHRFPFVCLVIAGEVHNTIYEESVAGGDEFSIGELRYSGAPGQYDFAPGTRVARFREFTSTYVAGQLYSMSAEQIHSIRFTRGTMVLFLEGPTAVDMTQVLEPFANGKRVPTFETKPWMFEKA